MGRSCWGRPRRQNARSRKRSPTSRLRAIRTGPHQRDWFCRRARRFAFPDAVPSIRSAVARVDASLPLYNLQIFGQVRSEYLATRRFTMTTMVAFGSVAFGLAALGLYGIVSYLVRLRTREIGIRIAVGAT
jgi:hypothetical protein